MSELRRRAAFWRNLEYDLDHMADSVDSRMADKWCNDNDLLYMTKVKVSLLDGLNKVRERYIEVLQEQIESED